MKKKPNYCSKCKSNKIALYRYERIRFTQEEHLIYNSWLTARIKM